jgi:hypothetical protein
LTAAPRRYLRPQPSAQLVGVVATALAWMLSLYIVIDSILSVRRLYFAAPYGDMWWFVRDMSRFRSHRIGLSFLWQQHNEHRIVLPRLIFWIDLSEFHFRGIFTIFCTFLCQAVEALVLCVAYWRATERCDAICRLAYAALAVGMMFSASQMENFILPFQVQFVLAFLTASVSIFMVLLHCENPEDDWVAMLLVLFAAACSTISLSSGLLVWPVLVLVCLVEHTSRKTVATVVIAGVSIWIFYFIGYRTSSYLGNPGVSLMHPVRAITESCGSGAGMRKAAYPPA